VHVALRLFIVEDHTDLANAFSEMLSADGVCETVGRARSESEALAWSFHNEAGFDVAIVDLMLQEGSGFTVIAHLNKYQPGKVIVLSEFVTPVIAERCKAMGAIAAFPKSRFEDCVRLIRGLPTSS
jgi:DNA-binding NarL/FixJ family response regulator